MSNDREIEQIIKWSANERNEKSFDDSCQIKTRDILHAKLDNYYIEIKDSLLIAVMGELGNNSFDHNSGRLFYEKKPVIEANIKHLDEDRIKNYIRNMLKIKKQFKKSEFHQLLANLGILVKDKETIYPTIAGVVLFGRYPQGFLPTATLKAYFFSGNEKDMRFVKDKEEIEGTLPEVIDKALAFIKKNRRIVPDMTGVRRKDIPAYPDYSAREILSNAVAHRDYSLTGAKIEVLMFDDRMEIISPGNLPSVISIDRLGIDHYSRNPLIAKILSQLDYIEDVGMGIKRVREEMGALKLPFPRFENIGINFKVSFLCPKVSEEFEKKRIVLNARQQKTIDYLREGNIVISKKIYMSMHSVSNKTAYLELLDLTAKKILRKEGKGRSVVYRLGID